MLKKTVDVNLLGEKFLELLLETQNQVEITLIRDGIPLAKISPLPSNQTIIPKAGLNRDSMIMAEDFDQPLPDDFWGI